MLYSAKLHERLLTSERMVRAHSIK